METYPHIRRDNSAARSIIDNLITSEEQQSIRVVLERLHNSERPVQVRRIIGSPRLTTIDALSRQRRIDVDQHVYPHRVEDAGAHVVVQVRVDIVDSDGVDAQLLHQRRVSKTDVPIAQRVGAAARVVAGGSTWLICKPDDLEAVVGDRVDEVGASDRDGLDGEGEVSAKREERQDGLQMYSH